MARGTGRDGVFVVFGSAVEGGSAALAAMIGLCRLIFLDVLTWTTR